MSLIRGGSNVGAEIDRSNRIRLIATMNPYMADNPAVLDAMSGLPMDTETLASNAVGTYGMMMGDELAGQLERMSEASQRSLWSMLPPARQQALTQLGYRRPDDPGESMLGKMLGPVDEVVGGVIGGFNKAAVTAGGTVWDGLNWVMEKPAQLYRTIRTMDDRNQQQALGAAALGIGTMLVTRGRSGSGGTLRAIGEIAGVGLLSAGAGAAITNPRDFAEAFTAARNGEMTFKRGAVRQAQDLLGEPRIITLAKEVADADISVEELAREMAGINAGALRGGADNAELAKLEQIIGRYAAQGSPEYEQAFSMLYSVTQDPTFRDAVTVLRNGKISPGRDVAGLFFDQGTRGYTILSGTVDAAFQVAVDPTLIGTEVFKLARLQRYGMRGLEGSEAVQRFLTIQQNNTSVRRLHEIVAHGIDTEDFELIRQMAPSFSPLYLDALAYKRELAVYGKASFDLPAFNSYMVNKTQLAPLMRGVGTMKAVDGIVLARMGRGTEKWKAITAGLRKLTDSMADVRIERDLVETIKASLKVDANSAPMVVDQLANDDILRAALPASLFGEVDEAGRLVMPWHETGQSGVEKLGRFFGETWIGSKAGNTLTSITTMIPRGKAIALVNDAAAGLSATDDIPKLTELGRLMGMPSWARREWSNAILAAANPGERMRLVNGWLDNALTMAGAKTTAEGRDIVAKVLERNLQAYGAGDVDKLVQDGIERAVSLLPSQQAVRVVMPDLHELRKAAMTGHLADFLGLADTPFMEATMNRVWKPAVLLRVAFIPRAAGEEFLNLMMRGAMGMLGQELGARSIARREVIADASRKAVERLTPVEAEMLKQGWTGTLPAHLRPFGRNLDRYRAWQQTIGPEDQAILRMMARYRWTDPTQRMMEDYAGWLNRQLSEGTALGRRTLGPVERSIARVERRLPGQVAVGGRNVRVRENITSNLNTLAFGNQYSWRRMMLGGVDDELVKSLKPFYRLHSRAIMGSVSAVSAGPLAQSDGALSVMQTVPTLQDGEIRAQEFLVVRGHFTRIASDDPRFANAVLEERAMLTADPVIQRLVASELSRIKGTSVTMTDDVIADVLDQYHTAMSADLSLKLVGAELASGSPDRDNFLVMLQNLQEVRSTPIQGSTLAERLRDAMPSGRDITWTDVEPVLRAWGQQLHPPEKAEAFLGGIDQLGRALYQLENTTVQNRRFVSQLLRQQETGWRVTGNQVRASLTENPVKPWAFDEIDAAARRADLAEADRDLAVYGGITVDELRNYKGEQINALTREADDFASELERIGATVDHATGKPRFAISPKQGSPEWEWWFALSGRQRRHLARTYFSSGIALPIDELASAAGLTVDEWGQQFVRLASKHTAAVSERAVLKRTNLVKFREEFLATSPDMRQLTARRDQLASELDVAQRRAAGEVVDEVETVAPAAASPFYNSWDEARENIVLRLKGMLLDANEQDAVMSSLRLSVLGEQGKALQEGMVQLYVPQRLWRPDGAPVTIEDVLRHADDQRVVMANRVTVEGMLQALIDDPTRSRAFVLADPTLARELDKVAARLRGATPDPNGLRVVDMEREVLDGRMRGITGGEYSPTENQQMMIEQGADIDLTQRGWLRPLAKDPADRRIEASAWDMPSEILGSRLRPMDATLDEKAQAWAEKIEELLRQKFTRGTREELVARRLKQADGTTRPGVFTKVGKDLVEVPEGEVVEFGRYFDRKGRELAFGDTQFFETKGATMDIAGDPMWELLGPMFEDVYDNLGNLPRMLPKDNDAVRVYRANVSHVRDANIGLPNYAIAELLATKRESWWDRFTRFGFDRVIGPSIDALVRRPMATHYYAQRYKETARWMESFGDPGITTALNDIALRFQPVEAADEVRKAHDVLRKIAQRDGHAKALQWTDAQASAFARGFGREEIAAMVDRIAKQDAEGAGLAKRYFQLHTHVRGTTKMSPGSTGADLVARLQAVIPDDAWFSRYDLQKYVRETFVDPEMRVVGRRAEEVADGYGAGRYVVYELDEATGKYVTEGETVSRQTAVEMGSEEKRQVKFKVLAPAEYRAPELEEQLLDVREMATTLQSGTVKPADIDYVLGLDDSFVDQARARWAGADEAQQSRLRSKALGPQGADASEDEVIDALAAQMRRDGTAKVDERRRQAERNGVDPIMAIALDDDVAETLVAWRKQQDWMEREAGERAAIASIEDMLPFIDSHEFRTQWAEVGKGFLPFWYAEENFMKRWARTLRNEGPAVIAKATLGYMGLRHAGVIRQDQQGKDWFIYPGSGLLAEALAKLPFMPDTLPVSMMLASPTESMLPGMSSKFGVPSFSPLVSVPVTAITSAVPELEPAKRALLGDYGAGRNALEQLVPAWVVNTFDAIRTNEGNSRYSSAQLSAIAQLEANGQGLPDNATAGEQQLYLDRVRNHARVILFAQALSGFFTPGPSSQFYVDQETLFGMGATDIASQLSGEYQSLIRNMGIEAGTQAFLESNPDADITSIMAYTVGKTETASGAPVMPTEQAMEFYADHEDYLVEFPNAGPWLLPQSTTAKNVRSMYAYDQQLGNELRRRRSPEEFLAAIKFKEASGQYFEVKDAYVKQLDQLKAAGADDEAKALTDRWESWSVVYKQTHPIFRDQLDSSDGRIQRRNTLEEMRVIVHDPGAPQAEHFEPLRQLIGYWDAYTIRKAALSEDQSKRGRERLEVFKTQFGSALEGYVAEHPEVRSFWLSVLRPEAGFD